ncbi:MAG TPA: DUF222 domain-containing protein [Acidimicrobiia bacterium]|nr:DUF222 domain-containing protein [Acidimicrobiia bacterium]
MLFMTRSPDEMVERLRQVEAEISDLRCEQAVLINELDKLNVAGSTGHRSINEWLSAELDMSKAITSEMVFAGRHLAKYRPINFRLTDGDITFDRAVATMRLADAGADEATLVHSESLDLAAVRRLTARQRRITRRDERQVFADRFVSVRPTLDGTSRRVVGDLPGMDGHRFEQALYARADELRRLPGGELFTRGQLQADALVAMAIDSLGRSSDGNGESPAGGSVTVLIDLDEANRTGGEHGCEIEYGPRVGPDVLEELLCTGSVQVVGLQNGTPVVTSQATKAIPPAVRRFVAQRDGGCTISGCTSRYRLEPHHITARVRGGTDDPENLTTLCWFHHHVAIHQQGFRIDPDTPPFKRRLVRARTGHDPP